MRGALIAALAAVALGSAVRAQPPRPTIDVYVRSQAGLPPSSARGEIEIVEVGHNPLDTVLSIVGHRTANGWRVSYVCGQSPACDPKRFMLAKAFDLPPEAARQLDAALARVVAEPEPDPWTGPPTACGRLAVNIDDRGVKRSYRRVCQWSKAFGELEAVMKPSLP